MGQLRVPAHTFHTFQEERKVCTVAGGRSAQRLGLGQELPPHPHGRASVDQGLKVLVQLRACHRYLQKTITLAQTGCLL